MKHGTDHRPMRPARAGGVVTLVDAVGFGGAAIPVAAFLLRAGRLPNFFGMFDLYAGPWSARLPHRRLAALLLGFSVVETLVGWTGLRLLRHHRRHLAVVNLSLLPVEAVFWRGFALPLAWPAGVARLVLVGGRLVGRRGTHDAPK
jgi:hypothetical protein